MRQSLRSPWALLFSLVSLAAGCALALAAELWWMANQPNIIEVHSVDIIDQVDGGHTLLVDSSGPPAQDCLRFSQHVIYRDRTSSVDGSKRDYVPLAMAVNGTGFSSVADFTVMLFVAPEVPAGDWLYVNRSVYACTVFPGFVKFTESASKPFIVTLR